MCFRFLQYLIANQWVNEQLATGIEKYNLGLENIYNQDEKGFIIRLMNRVYRIMTLEALWSRRITHTMTDGNREFVTLLACICADGTSTLVSLIYKGESHNLQDSWVDQIEETDEVYFAASANGWTYKSLGLQWLQKVFNPATKAKAGQSKRLLIVNGHSSYVNMEFIN